MAVSLTDTLRFPEAVVKRKFIYKKVLEMKSTQWNI